MDRSFNAELKIRPEIFKVSPYVPGKPIDEVKRELGIDDVIKLASNELPFEPPEAVRQALLDVSFELNRYPDSYSYYLRKRISEKFGIDKKNIVFGNGSSELIKLIADALVSKGSRVIYAEPSFVMYPIVVDSRGGEKVEIPLRSKDLAHDLKAMLNAIDEKTSMVIVCNPNNPTGTITPRGEIEEFLELVPDDVFVLFDEAYAEFADSRDFVSGVEFFKQGKPNVGVLRSFSKAYGLAGLRLGYGFLPEKLVDAVDRIREPFNVNLVAQKLSLVALECEDEYEKMRQKVIQERKRMEEKLKESGFKVYPSQANFIFVDSGVNSALVFKELIKKGVIVRDGSIFGPDYQTFLRITVGKEEENDRFINDFIDTVEKIKKGEIG